MKRSGLIRRSVGLLVGTALIVSLATPARAQFDPITLSLIMGGVQLLTGVAAAISLGANQDGRGRGIAMPNGTPCGLEDGVPQICWAPHNGGFEGSPDLPTGYKPFTKPQQAPPTPTMELELKPLEPAATGPTQGPTQGPAPGQ
jgi:hypothetical protein